MLDRVDRSFIGLWSMFWVLLCGIQWLLGSGAAAHPGEVVHVPRHVRLFFGLAPSTDTLRVLPAIMQGMALIMMPVSIWMRRFVTMNDLELAMLLIVVYWLAPVVMRTLFSLRNR